MPPFQVLPLEVNGLYRVLINISGEGAPLRVELAAPTNKTVAFGAVARTQSASRVLKLANR